jgi:hypothetical protein
MVASAFSPGLSGHHLAAFLRALVAGFSALLAMLHFVFGAFVAARLTNVRAQSAEFPGEPRPARHESHGETADVSAVAIQFDAAHHHFDVLFVQTRGRAMFAGGDAFVAGVDAALILFVFHIFSLSVVSFVLLIPRTKCSQKTGKCLAAAHEIIVTGEAGITGAGCTKPVRDLALHIGGNPAGLTNGTDEGNARFARELSDLGGLSDNVCLDHFTIFPQCGIFVPM